MSILSIYRTGDRYHDYVSISTWSREPDDPVLDIPRDELFAFVKALLASDANSEKSYAARGTFREITPHAEAPHA